MKFRKIELPSRTKLILGKDEKSNDELMKEFEGKGNTILHTTSPGSPFGVIDKLNPTKEEILLSGSYIANFSQDWRDNKRDVLVDVFTGKDISKPKGYKLGTWKVKKKKTIKIKKVDVLKFRK